jgi:nucleotide-binding universal stress UspA family protein
MLRRARRVLSTRRRQRTQIMKQVTIFIDGSANDRVSLASALAFCRCLDGRLKVVHPRPPDDVVASPDGQTVVLVKNEEERAARRDDARAAYDEICGGLAFTDWQETEETVTEAIVSFGLYSDVVALERLSDEEGPEVLTLNTALFETPGPVLVTPPKAPEVIGRSVVVVWSPTVQSARVVRSALPILQKAESVTTITNSTRPEADPSVLSAYLETHGIKTDLGTFDGGGLTARGRGRAILAAAAKAGADLLVMGAYGENRLTALIGLGRATRKVVSATTIPALIQH